MIVVECKQGSPEWIAARLGIPTSSNFDRILTPKTMKLSAAADTYMAELLAEWMTGAALDAYVSEWMERGTEMESQAVAYYEMQRDIDTQAVGFVLRDDRMVGCSPDRLVAADGGLEIKCPGAVQHVKNLQGMGRNHYGQVQGSLWVTGRKWWDLLSFHPTIPPALVRYERDDEYIEKLAVAVDAFVERLGEARGEMAKAGYADA